ncbi:MAG: hypothetical protein KKD25_07090 [Gammaproteobacteria bacterium]|jgi:hypothetical protein|nr:hypothetical protein [Gammaproteobacteria bacterium]MBU0772635.1 hypothetical protein [Gammaproteobacteria bacterium]MBU0856840.1 hypothetical protein [Gammaproteobacteria bacterium]MBU1846438.1 hypothetical protein [Gammaproteobacteria bacterium]
MMPADEGPELKFRRYSIAAGDFEEAAKLARQASHHSPDSLEREALLFMAIVVYFRPFSTNERRQENEIPPSAPRLMVKDFAPLSMEEESVHNACKQLRNRVLAHAEFSFYPSSLDPDSGVMSRQRSSLMSPIIEDGVVIWPFGLEQFCTLADKLAKECHHWRADHAIALRDR